MQKTPLSQRKHVVLFGDTNAGKSALFNQFLGQDVSIVSNVEGTTTDPVIRAMELIPFGPIALVDTAGLSDNTDLGKQREQKTKALYMRCDLALYIADGTDFHLENYQRAVNEFQKYHIDYQLIFSKADLLKAAQIKKLKNQFPSAVFISIANTDSISQLKKMVSDFLMQSEPLPSLIGDLLPKGATVLMVVPVDSEAPSGRLILPQVQLIRDCLDRGIACHVVRETELSDALNNLHQLQLVVTDSQVFHIVNQIVPKTIPLTSFSILMARQKGDLEEYAKNAKKVLELPNQANILMLEACTHNHTHEDIGRVKIPKLMEKITGKHFTFHFFAGHDFPEHLDAYDFAVHCGGCMITRKTMLTRTEICRENHLPITNYGVLLAFLNGILDRSLEIFQNPLL